MSKFIITVISAFFMLCAGIYTVSIGREAAGNRSDNKLLKCPSEDFKEFLSFYTESVDIQKAFTTNPLTKQHLDPHAQPDPKPISRKLKLEDVKFPIIQKSSDQKSLSLILEINEIENQQAKITLRKEDTDFQVNYFFKKDRCWTLDRIEDWSL